MIDPPCERVGDECGALQMAWPETDNGRNAASAMTQRLDSRVNIITSKVSGTNGSRFASTGTRRTSRTWASKNRLGRLLNRRRGGKVPAWDSDRLARGGWVESHRVSCASTSGTIPVSWLRRVSRLPNDGGGRLSGSSRNSNSTIYNTCSPESNLDSGVEKRFIDLI